MATGKRKRKKTSKPKRRDPKQSARFVAAAKEMGLGGSGEDFERAMNALAPKKPKRRSS